ITKAHEHVAVKLKIDVGFLNDKTPIHYRNKPVFVIVLLGTSDGHRIEFFRISASKLQNINPITKTAYLTSPTQLLEAYVMCDDLAGTMQEAVLKPDIPLSAFRSIKDTTADIGRDDQAVGPTLTRLHSSTDADEWDDGVLNDDDFIGAEPREDDFMDVDALGQPMFSLAKNGKSKNKISVTNTVEALGEQRLENGNYACNHRCKDRNACKHKCCKEGLEKKPKPKKPKDSESSTTSKSKTTSTSSTKVQSKLELPIRRKVASQPVEHLDLSQASASSKARVPTAAARLPSLHSSTTRSNRVPTLGATSVMPVTPASGGNVARPRLYQSPNFLRSVEEETYNDSPSMQPVVKISGDDVDDVDDDKILSEEEDYMDKDEEMLDAALVGLEDSQSLQTMDETVESTQSPDMLDFGADYQEDSDEPTLFVTPHPQRVNDFTGGFEDAAAMFDQNMDDYDSTLSGMVKRKRDEGVSSVYFSAKKTRTDDDIELQNIEEQAQKEKGDEESVENKEKREKEELRAWLAAELGESVEMI
ncbi:hypothetical protein KCU63_g17557, partial [Aureobasidium melanogenum]